MNVQICRIAKHDLDYNTTCNFCGQPKPGELFALKGAQTNLSARLCESCLIEIQGAPLDGDYNKHRGKPIFDRFYSQIVKAIHNEDGQSAYDTFVNALNKAAEGKAKL